MILRLLLSAAAMAPLGLATQYYLDSSDPRASDSGLGTRDQPWSTLTALDRHTFQPGDRICFAPGSRYRGGFVIKDSGTSEQPITFSVCGSGPPPSLSNPGFSVLNGNVIQVLGSHIVIEGLAFHDGASSPNTKTRVVMRVGDVYILKPANYIIVRDCDFTNSPIAVHINGEHCLISGNRMHGCNRPLAGTAWGPIAIFIANANNEISHNRITNYISRGGNYGADGGALEIDSRVYGGKVHDVSIHHNYSQGNEGFLEVAEAEGALDLRYNVSNDYQQFVILYKGRSCRFENNTVLRLLPKNSVTDVVFTFKAGGNIIRNNIFVVNNGRKVMSTNGTQVWGRNNYAGQIRSNNLYFSLDGSQADPCGLPLGPGERIADPLFAGLMNGDLHLLPNSPAIDAGLSSGPATDFDGVAVPQGKAPDIGAFEFRPTP